MFTGIVETIGTVTTVTDHGATARLTIHAPGLSGSYQHGESISVNGVCLTVAASTDDAWEADVMRVTVDTTTVGALRAGDQVNLERAVRVDTRLGGHLVQGHIDGTAVLVSRDSQDDWDDFSFRIPADLVRYVVAKGSIALNGVSLTVASIADDVVTVSLIPTTLDETALGALSLGDQVNVEVDIIGKYVESLLGGRS